MSKRKRALATSGICLVLAALSASKGLSQGKVPMRLQHTQSVAKISTAPAPEGPASSSAYTFTIFDFPGSLATYGGSLNLGATASKQEIVSEYAATPSSTAGRGFVLDLSSSKGVVTEAFSPVNYPGSVSTSAEGVNDSGQIVGLYTDSSGVLHGWELSGGQFTAINVPSSGWTAAEGINDAGDIVGSYYLGGTLGFEYSGGTYTTIQVPNAEYTEPVGINNNGDIVGQDYLDGAAVGFEYSGGTYTTIEVPGATSTSPVGINDSGEIVGVYCTASCAAENGEFGQQGFLLSGGVYTTISIPGAANTLVYSISDAGVIAGQYTDGNYATGLQHGFIGVPK